MSFMFCLISFLIGCCFSRYLDHRSRNEERLEELELHNEYRDFLRKKIKLLTLCENPKSAPPGYFEGMKEAYQSSLMKHYVLFGQNFWEDDLDDWEDTGDLE